MSDGAHNGIGAERALKTILGGKPAPTKSEAQTREQVRQRLKMTLEPLTGTINGYDEAADCIANAFLIVMNEHEKLLTMDEAWDAAKAKWPGFNDWIRGATGFQVGWAYNTVLWLKGEPPVGNPAILEIED